MKWGKKFSTPLWTHTYIICLYISSFKTLKLSRNKYRMGKSVPNKLEYWIFTQGVGRCGMRTVLEVNEPSWGPVSVLPQSPATSQKIPRAISQPLFKMENWWIPYFQHKKNDLTSREGRSWAHVHLTSSLKTIACGWLWGCIHITRSLWVLRETLVCYLKIQSLSASTFPYI